MGFFIYRPLSASKRLARKKKQNNEKGRYKRLGEVKFQFPILGDAKRKDKKRSWEVLMPGDR